MKKTAAVAGLAALVFFSVISLLHADDPMTDYQHQETKDVVSLVRDTASIIEASGESSFQNFKKEGSVWRHGKTYVFVLDSDGNMVVHPDPALEGKNDIELKDVNGKPIIRGLIEEVTADPAKKEGWYHYKWPEPGGLFPGWKTTFVRGATAPSGKTYIVCCGLYNMKMERAFIVKTVNDAVALIEKEGRLAFPALRDKSTQFNFLDTYVFVDTPEGLEVVNPAFPSVEGKNIMNYKDQAGKYLTKELINVALKKGSGWVDYLWPKPGESAPATKHTYVKKAVYGNETFIVGCGAYLEPGQAGEAESATGKIMAIELKDGKRIFAEILRETKDSYYLANADGSMEVSFPRGRIAKIRKPTVAELEKLNKDKAAAAAADEPAKEAKK